MPLSTPRISDSWQRVIGEEFDKPYMRALREFLASQNSSYTLFPLSEHIFYAFWLTPFEAVKVVILGQDPYHGPNQAHGLAFSVQNETKIPPSLQNIFKELSDDVGCETPTQGDLTSWASQGVLLLNAVLTVRAHEANSHANQGWEIFTDSVIRAISSSRENVVFILWGRQAQQKIELIDTSKHHIISSVHPSPLSVYRGFFGSKPFSRANAYMVEHAQTPIMWCL